MARVELDGGQELQQHRRKIRGQRAATAGAAAKLRAGTPAVTSLQQSALQLIPVGIWDLKPGLGAGVAGGAGGAGVA